MYAGDLKPNDKITITGSNLKGTYSVVKVTKSDPKEGINPIFDTVEQINESENSNWELLALFTCGKDSDDPGTDNSNEPRVTAIARLENITNVN